VAYIEPHDLNLIIAEVRDRVRDIDPVESPLLHERAFRALIVAERAKNGGESS
jgi:hypothetical protein